MAGTASIYDPPLVTSFFGVDDLLGQLQNEILNALGCTGSCHVLAAVVITAVAPEAAKGAGGLIGQSFGKLGTVVDIPELDISGFTGHGIDQAISRGVSPSDLLNTVKNPSVVLQQSGGQYLFLSNQAGVVLNPAGQVITAYPSSMFGPGVINVMSQLSITQ